MVKARQAPDIALPGVVAPELSPAALVLDDARGALLILPFAGETIACVTLTMSDEHCSVDCIPRHDDPGMRLADYLVLGEDGVLFMTERSF